MTNSTDRKVIIGKTKTTQPAQDGEEKNNSITMDSVEKVEARDHFSRQNFTG